MKTQETIKSTSWGRILLLCGISLAILSLTTITPIAFQEVASTDSIESNAGTETDQEHSKEESISVNAFEAITSSVQFQLNQELLLIHELPVIGQPREEVPGEDVSPFATNKVIRILLRRIISPNAP